MVDSSKPYKQNVNMKYALDSDLLPKPQGRDLRPQIAHQIHIGEPKVLTDANDCTSCKLCCKVLKIEPEPATAGPPSTIEYEGKDWNVWCKHCDQGAKGGGCTIYSQRPWGCRQFQCIWHQSHRRSDTPALSPRLKPDKCHVVMMGSYDDPHVMFAHCDPDYPQAWHQGAIYDHLRLITNRGITVVVCMDDERYIMVRGRIPVRLTEDQIVELTGGLQARLADDGRTVQFGVPTTRIN
jgi:Fe-S-cluster containining protein